MQKLKVLVVDDYSTVRQGIETFLNEDPQIQVVGTAINGMEGIEKTRELKPDVVLMDTQMPGMDGLEATEIIKREMPEVRVLVLTGETATSSIKQALKAGADGYILKSISADELRHTIKNSSGGRVLLSMELMENLTGTNQPLPVGTKLTERELEILRLIGQGKANKEIAHKLILSEGTIKTHVSIIMSKLGLQSRVQAALFANEHGLL